MEIKLCEVSFKTFQSARNTSYFRVSRSNFGFLDGMDYRNRLLAKLSPGYHCNAWKFIERKHLQYRTLYKATEALSRVVGLLASKRSDALVKRADQQFALYFRGDMRTATRGGREWSM